MLHILRGWWETQTTANMRAWPENPGKAVRKMEMVERKAGVHVAPAESVAFK